MCGWTADSHGPDDGSCPEPFAGYSANVSAGLPPDGDAGADDGAGLDCRAAAVAYFAAAFPAATVSIDATGGGCEWLAIRFPDRDTYYALTDGDACMPTDDDGRPVRGGWRYIGRHTDDDGAADYPGTELVFRDPDVYNDADGLTDDDAAAAIVADLFPVGSRVVLARDVERFPHFVAPAGASGTVTVNDVTPPSAELLLCVRLDEPLQGAEEWRNEVAWYGGMHPAADLIAGPPAGPAIEKSGAVWTYTDASGRVVVRDGAAVWDDAAGEVWSDADLAEWTRLKHLRDAASAAATAHDAAMRAIESRYSGSYR